MDGKKNRPQIGRADSNMQSVSPDNTKSSSAPLRAAVARPENQEFSVAGPDFGGLPLDKAVKDTIKEGKKEPEAINQAHENFEHHVKVPLKKPTQTICISMGGGRNAAPTEIGFGGPNGSKPKDDTPKEFVYRDEDFPAPTSAKEPPHGARAAPYLGLDHLFFRKGPTKKDDASSSGTDTPEMNLNSLFPEEAIKLKIAPHQQQPYHSKKHSSGTDTPEMGLDKLFPEDIARKEPQHDPFNAPAHMLHTVKKNHLSSSSPLKTTPTRQDTPEMNLNSLFLEDNSQASKKSSSYPLKNTLTRQDTPEMNLGSLFLEDSQSPSHPKKKTSSPMKSTLARQDTPEMNLDKLFPEDATNKAPQHEPFNAPAHLLHQVNKIRFSSSAPLKSTPTRQDTPEMNLDKLFPEDSTSSSQPKKKPLSPLKDTPTRQDTPEMNLGSLFPEENQARSQHKKKTSPLKNTLARQDTPEMNLNKLFSEDSASGVQVSAQHVPHHDPFNAPAHLIHRPNWQHPAGGGTPEMNLNSLFLEDSNQASKRSSSYPLKKTLTRQDTPEMNLGSLFPEDNQSPSHPKKKPMSPLKDTLIRQDTPEMNLGNLFKDQSVPTVRPPVGHAHAVPANRPKKNSDKPGENAQNDDPSDHHKHMHQPREPHSKARHQQSNMAGKPSDRQAIPGIILGSLPLRHRVERQDTPEMHLNDLFIEGSPSSQSKQNAHPRSLRNNVFGRPSPASVPLPASVPGTPKMSESIISSGQQAQHDLHHGKVELLPSVHISHGIVLPAYGASNKTTSISLEDLLNDEDVSDHSPYDSPVSARHTPAAASHPFFDQSSSMAAPSAPKLPSIHIPSIGMPHLPSLHAPSMPSMASIHLPSFGAKKAKKANKPSKRNRKAERKNEAKRQSSIMDNLSSAFVGRKKNSVSSPVMRLNELFDEPSDLTLTAATAGASRVGGIRNMLPTMSSIHMPHMPAFSRHSAEHIHDAASASGSAIAAPKLNKHKPSKAAALKMPKIDPTLLPEEQANYPRGDSLTHENPAPSRVEDMLEVKEVQLQKPKIQMASAFGTVTAAPQFLKHKPSKAVAVKKPKIDLTLLPEEQANYPRGGSLIHENPAPSRVEDMLEVKEVQLQKSKIQMASAFGTVIAAPQLLKHKPSKAVAADYPRGDIPRRHNPAPSNVEDIIEIHKIPTLPVHIHRHPVSVFRADVPKDGKKTGKRGRKAQRKHEATRRHSIMDTISTALVGRKKNSVSSPVMRLNELFDEPSAMSLPAPAGPRLGGILNMLPSAPSLSTVQLPSLPTMPSLPAMPSMPTMPAMHLPEVHVPTVHLPEMHLPEMHLPEMHLPEMHLPEMHLPEMRLPSLPAMPTLALPHLSKSGSATAHGVAGPVTLLKHEPSIAVALKMPKVDITLLPEEQASYPRGDIPRLENPLPSHIEAMVEVQKVTYKRPEPSKAIAIKVSKIDATLLPEEQASYPRGDVRRRENPAPANVEDIIEVKEIHVPAALPLIAKIPAIAAASLPKTHVHVATAPILEAKEKFVPSEHHRRSMEIHGITDDEENYYSADDEPAPIMPRKNVVPISVLPPVQVETRKAIVTHAAHVVPNVAPVVVPVITQKTVVTEPHHVIPKSTVPIAQPPVEVKKIPIAQPPVEIKKIPIAQPPVEVRRIPIAQPPVITKSTVTATVTAPAVPKIEIAKPSVQEIKEIKEVKVVSAPKPESNVSSARKPSAAELYANEHRTLVDDTKLADKIAHAPRPIIPAVIETKKTDVETQAPKIVETPKVVDVKTTKTVEELHHKAAPVPAPRPDTIMTKTTVTTTSHADPVPAPRPVVAAVAAAPMVAAVHHHHHKEVVPEPAPVQTEQQTTKTTRTTVVEPILQPAQKMQEVKRVVEVVHRHTPQPQIQQQYQEQQTIAQQSAPVAALFDSGERTMLVRKLYTTIEYYDSEDEDELDEFGYRKDRDVSLHIAPMPTSQSRRNSLEAYRARKNSGVSNLDANIAALNHQDALTNG
ncbi:hypothetical protein BGZ95_001581, partial [Linnemannia exigua]